MTDEVAVHQRGTEHEPRWTTTLQNRNAPRAEDWWDVSRLCLSCGLIETRPAHDAPWKPVSAPYIFLTWRSA